MKTSLLVIVIFLNLFFRLASAQWSDDTLLLRDISSEDINSPGDVKANNISKRGAKHLSGKKSINGGPGQSPVPSPTPIMKPDQGLNLNSEINPNLNLDRKNGDSIDSVDIPETNADLMVGIRKLEQQSNFSYKNVQGETPTLGITAGLIYSKWSWSLRYDTGILYHGKKSSNLGLRDDLVELEIKQKIFDPNYKIAGGLYFFEEQLVNKNPGEEFIGNKVKGFAVAIQQTQPLDEGADLTYTFMTSPIFLYNEQTTGNSNRTGDSAAGIKNTIQLEVAEKWDAENSILLNAKYNWTQVQFNGTTSVPDTTSNELINGARVKSENYSFQIGYRWRK